MGVEWALLAEDANKWCALRRREMVRGAGAGMLLSKDDTVLGSQERPYPM